MKNIKFISQLKKDINGSAILEFYSKLDLKVTIYGKLHTKQPLEIRLVQKQISNVMITKPMIGYKLSIFIVVKANLYKSPLFANILTKFTKTIQLCLKF